MPDVVGLDVHDARAVLRNAGIDEFRVNYTETYATEHSVVTQEPRGGLLIERERAVALHVCRRSLVQYLPQVFQQAAPSGSFLRGLLYVVQQVSDSVLEQIAHMHELFDPRTAREEFLPWLASWLSITLSPDWNELQRRQMLLTATRLFPYRGTVRSIREFVRIYTGAHVEVEENVWPYNGFRIGVNSAVGLDTVILPPMNLAHCFVVRLDRPGTEVSDEEIIKIHQIIQLQKPAHTSYFLAFSDDDNASSMAVFVEIGHGAIGVGGGAIGMMGGDDVSELIAAGAEGASEGEAPKPSRRARSSRSTASDAVRNGAEGDEDEGEERRAARRRRAAAAAAAREARKVRASNRAKERQERSAARASSSSDEGLGETPAQEETVTKKKAASATRKAPKEGDAIDSEVSGETPEKPSSRKGKAASAAEARQKRKEASERRAAERAAKKAARDSGKSKGSSSVTDTDSAKDSGADDAAARREARREKTAAAAAARQKRKDEAAARAAKRASAKAKPADAAKKTTTKPKAAEKKKAAKPKAAVKKTATTKKATTKKK
ncbi:MAG: phage tail protein I [Myxococcota bacterium]